MKYNQYVGELANYYSSSIEERENVMFAKLI